MLDMKKFLTGTAVAVSSLVSAQAVAETTGSLNVTSEYMWRGVESSGGAAVQGSFDWSSPTGIYAGGWVSNTAPGVNGNELDLYAGWAGEMGQGVGVDLGLVAYIFSEDQESGKANTGVVNGYDGDGDFIEVYAGLSYMGLSGSLYYAPDYFGVDGSRVYGGVNKQGAAITPIAKTDGEGVYLTLAYTASIKEGLDMTFQVGQSSGDGVEAFYGDEIVDWSITTSKDLGDGWGVSGAYVDSDWSVSANETKANVNGGAAGKAEFAPKFVVSVSKEFAL